MTRVSPPRDASNAALFERTIASPFGPLRVVASDVAVVGVYWPGHRPAPRFFGEPGSSEPIFDRAERELTEYFGGRRRVFSVPIDPLGTAFQREVWAVLGEIPWGETRTYGEIAAALGRPGGARAVGTACGRNPLSIFVPCHRVVPSGGGLGGYAGGLPAKRGLLRLEQFEQS